MDRLDSRTRYSSSMEEYLETYGYHFNKKLHDFAVSKMRTRSGGKLSPFTKEQVASLLKNNGIELKNDLGHDATYVANMAKADYWGSSIVDDLHIARFIEDFLDDVDGSQTKAFDHFVIDCVAKGEPIFWDEML